MIRTFITVDEQTSVDMGEGRDFVQYVVTRPWRSTAATASTACCCSAPRATTSSSSPSNGHLRRRPLHHLRRGRDRRGRRPGGRRPLLRPQHRPGVTGAAVRLARLGHDQRRRRRAGGRGGRPARPQRPDRALRHERRRASGPASPIDGIAADIADDDEPGDRADRVGRLDGGVRARRGEPTPTRSSSRAADDRRRDHGVRPGGLAVTAADPLRAGRGLARRRELGAVGRPRLHPGELRDTPGPFGCARSTTSPRRARRRPCCGTRWSASAAGPSPARAPPRSTPRASPGSRRDVVGRRCGQSGAGAGQGRRIVAFDAGTSTATLDEPWLTAPVTGDGRRAPRRSASTTALALPNVAVRLIDSDAAGVVITPLGRSRAPRARLATYTRQLTRRRAPAGRDGHDRADRHAGQLDDRRSRPR